MDREPVTVPSQTTPARGPRSATSSTSGAPWLAVTDDDGRYRGAAARTRASSDELRDGRPALTAAEVCDRLAALADRRLGDARDRAALGRAAPARRDRRRRRRRHPARRRHAAGHSPGDAPVAPYRVRAHAHLPTSPRIDARTRRPDHRRRPRRPARRARRRPRGRLGGDHEQGPPGALALGRGGRRDQRRDQPAGRLALARLRHGQGLGLPRRPGRDRDHVPRGARRGHAPRAHRRHLPPQRGRRARPARRSAARR